MKSSIAIALLLTAPGPAFAADSAIPAPVSAADFAELIERPPFRRHLSLSEALVLSGVARLPDGPVVTVWNRTTGETFVVTAAPNPQGWRLVDLAHSSDLRSVVATIAAADQKLSLRFDPERLIPPKLDNQSKPGKRSEGSLVVEALLRALDPAAARNFDKLPAEAQEKFRKGFTDFLAAYPSSSDDKRIAFVHRSLADAASPPEPPAGSETADRETTGATKPVPPVEPGASPAAQPGQPPARPTPAAASASPPPMPVQEPADPPPAATETPAAAREPAPE